MDYLELFDTTLNTLGYIVLGFWVLQFIFYAYIKGYKLKNPVQSRSNPWDYM